MPDMTHSETVDAPKESTPASTPAPQVPADPITVYNYHPHTGELVSQSLADESPLERGVFLVPGFASTEPPPQVKAHEVAVFKGGKWSMCPDWRGVTLYATDTGQPVSITEIGRTPADAHATDQPMPNPDHSWDGVAWVPDPKKAAESLRKAAALAIVAVDQGHADAVLTLTGRPTQTEQTTWAGKVALAEAIQAGSPLTESQAAFLASNGIATADRTAYAQAVIAKSKAYWTLVGIADKVRSDCKDRIKAAQTHEALAQAIADNAAQLAQTMAAVAQGGKP